MLAGLISFEEAPGSSVNVIASTPGDVVESQSSSNSSKPQSSSSAAAQSSKPKRSKKRKQDETTAEEEGGEGDEGKTAKKKRKKRKKGKQQKQQQGDGEGVETLRADEDGDVVMEGGEEQVTEQERARQERRKRQRERRKAKRAEKRKKQKLEKQKKQKQQQQAVEKAEHSEDWTAPESEWDRYQLHPRVLHAIHDLGFSAPTEIQRECLTAAIRDWKDVVGAAETGSGKTLAFGIPMMHRILVQQEAQRNRQKEGEEEQSALFGLVLTPTRELALQVTQHLRAITKYTDIHVVPVVGGMAHAKQTRLLRKEPEVIVATPGRFWDLASSGNIPLLERLSGVRMVVLDEADRMVSQGHFKELTPILRAIYYKEENVTVDEDFFDNLDSEAAAAAAAAASIPADQVKRSEVSDDSESEDSDARGHQKDADEEVDPWELLKKPSQPVKKVKVAPRDNVRRQTFLFSATLSLHTEARRGEMTAKQAKRLAKKKLTGRKAKAAEKLKHTTIDRIFSMVKFRGPPHVVDLSTQTSTAKSLQERKLEVLEAEKDLYLYYLLTQHVGKTIIFVNSIAAVRRLVGLLTELHFSVHPLHAGLQQRQRIRNLERFTSHPNAIIVCSDVAARGLDIPQVQFVFHYQMARTPELYVHRSGRTARAGEEGLSVALVSERDQRAFARVLRELNHKDMPDMDVNRGYLPMIRERLQLARKIDKERNRQEKVKKSNEWFRRAAKDMDVDLDDELLQETNKDAQKKKLERKKLEAMRARLRDFIKKPLLPKGLSRNFITLNAQMPAMPAAGKGKVDLTQLRR